MGYRYQDLAPIAIALLIVGVTLPIGGEILRDTGYASDPITHYNESHTFTNNTCLQLDHKPLGTISKITNYSTSIIEGGGDCGYSVCVKDHSSIKVRLNDSNQTTWNVSYSSYDTPMWRTAANATLGVEELGTWTDTIALVIAAAVVLGLIFIAFSRIGGGGGAV